MRVEVGETNRWNHGVLLGFLEDESLVRREGGTETGAEVERLLKLGAKLVHRPGKGHDYVILADPEGNHFCVVQT